MRDAKGKFISAPRPEMIGNQNPAWTGGRQKHNRGYISIRIYNKYILEHRYIMEKHLGRPLNQKEHIHHINGDKTDNRIENLQLTTITKHGHLHHPLGEYTCQNPKCKKVFQRKPSQVRYKSIYCSQKCLHNCMWITWTPRSSDRTPIN